MFTSFRNTLGNDKSAQNEVTSINHGDDFVQVQMDVDREITISSDELQAPSLSAQLISENDIIGTQSSKSNAKFSALIKASSLPDDDESTRAPVDIVVALDVSGSMSGNKLALCKETLTLLLRELGPNDRFGLVTFGSECSIIIPARKLSSQSKEIALNSIKKIHTHGCTNMSGGIGLAAQELQSIESPHEVRALFLLTDGHANAGVSKRDDLVALTKNCLGINNDKQMPIAIHCFGYGSDHDRELLDEVSQTTEGGTYYFVENDSSISAAFGDALGGVLSVVAQNVTLNIKVAPTAMGVEITKVYHDKAVKLEDGSYSVTVGDFYAEESRDVLFDVTLSSEVSDSPTPHATCSLSYMDTIQKRLVKGNHDVEGSISRPNSSQVSPSNQHIDAQALRLQTTDIIKRSEVLANGGNLMAARELINSQLLALKTSANDENNNHLIGQLQSELNEILVGLATPELYSNAGAYKMKKCAMSHKMQRCVESSCDTPSAYRSSKKAMLSMKWSK